MSRVCFTVGGKYGLLCRWTVLLHLHSWTWTSSVTPGSRTGERSWRSRHHAPFPCTVRLPVGHWSPKVIVVRSNDTDVCEFEEYQTLRRHKCNCPETYRVHMLSPAQFPCMYRLWLHVIVFPQRQGFDLLVKDRRFASAFGQLGSSRSMGTDVTDVNEARSLQKVVCSN